MSIDLEELGAVEPKRDRWGRPLVPPANGKGKPKAYTRPTTIADTLDDRHNLELWMQRQVAKGLAARPDLLALVATTDGDDKSALNKLCADARDAAASDAGANMGTAVHAAVERYNRTGEVLEHFRADVEAYAQALADAGAEVDPDHVEQFVVNDSCSAAGTFDMRLRIDGRWYVADLKTGTSVEWSARSFAVQLAIYAGHTSTFDWRTMTHGAPLDVDQERGIIVHLPAGSGAATLHWLDLAAGREALERALWVREWRKRKGILVPFETDGGGTTDATTAAPVVELAEVGPVDHPTDDSRRPRRIEPVADAPAAKAKPIDEGYKLGADKVAEIGAALDAAGPVAKATVKRWANEATHTLWTWKVEAKGTTQRRHALALAATKLAELVGDDDVATADALARQAIAMVIGEDACQSHLIGLLIGTLTVPEARRLYGVATKAAVRFADDGTPLLVA